MKKKAITKAVFINHLNETIGLSKRECQIFFETFLEVLMNSLKKKSDVKIVNFGIFKIKKKKKKELGETQKQKLKF